MLVETTWDAGTTTCQNALKSLCYEITYSNDFKIIGVAARLVVEDIAEAVDELRQRPPTLPNQEPLFGDD